MPQYEYKVIPAPVKGERVKGVKGSAAKFAHTLMALMNEMGREGWEYQRAESLPCEERSGLTGKTTVFQNMLIFRRALKDEVLDDAPAADEGFFVAAPIMPETGQAEELTPDEMAQAAAATLIVEGEETDEPDVAPRPDLDPAVLKERAAQRSGMAAE